MTVFAALGATVLIECEGGYPEKFINAATAVHLPLWDITYRGTSLFCRARAADYAALRPLSRRACVRMRIREKHGLPFAARRLGIRSGLIAGIALFFLVLQLLSSRIWVITVNGNRTLSDDDVLEMLRTEGVYVGTDFSTIDLPSLQLTALQRLPELRWLTLNQQGSTVTVEVAEAGEYIPLDSTAPTNLVASCDGVVVSVHAVRGQAMVRPGDAVCRGDLLISGVMDSEVGPQLKKATGSVIARTAHTLSVTIPLEETVILSDRTVRRPQLELFGCVIPLYARCSFPEPTAVTVDRYPLIANGVPLPVALSVTRWHYPTEHTIHRTEQEALAAAERTLADKERALLSFLTVESRVPHTERKNNTIVLTVDYRGTQELSQEVPLR